VREIFLLAAILATGGSPMIAAEPRVLVEGYKLELIAQEPDIVTPIGMTFDSQGRLLVVESHTHERPADYKGPPGDRIRMLADSNGDGRLDRWSTFAEGFQQAMNVYARPDGGVYVVTRRDVRLLRDTDGDGVADKDQLLLHLETTAEYPHNGMSGIVLEDKAEQGGRLYVAVGENLGVDYTIVGADGRKIGNTGGVGVVYQCRPDGTNLERVAMGFWNPFGICLAAGRLYCIDNDPDASPPCRLVEVLLGGDYGFRYEYGRAGVHPLLAWNGELPGTLPMICGVGEGPTALVSHRGYLWVTSWGDHRIERYELAPQGAGVTAKRTNVVQGDSDFRPTGMAVAPDGAIYFADWVDRSYAVHGRGRIWRLAVPTKDLANAPALGATRAMTYRTDPFAKQQLTAVLLEGHREAAFELAESRRADMKLAALKAIRFRQWGAGPEIVALLSKALANPDADVRLFAVRWIAEERIEALRDDVARLLDGEIPNERYFLAVLGALDWLDGDKSMRNSRIADGLLVRELKNSKRSPALHALALRLVSPDDPWLTIERLRDYLGSNDEALRLAAVRTLAARSDSERFALLTAIAGDTARESEIRAEAIAGLAPAVEANAELLEKLASDADQTVAGEAQRVRRLAGKIDGAGEAKPPAAELDRWNDLLATGGDAASGRRLFFTSAGPRCAVCHTHGGRGGRVGPDLTRLGAQQSRQRIVASILQPSREIAPEFQSWTLVTDDGLTHAGLRLPEGGDDGSETYADATGQRFTLASETIAERSPSTASIMPEGLERTLSVQDLRDLVEFLASGK